jgi:hypothetical protein
MKFIRTNFDNPFAQRNLLKYLPAQNTLEPLGFAGDQLLGRTKACSLRDSLQGFGVRLALLIRPNERTSFPLPSTGRLYSHREALLTNNFQRVAHATPDCKRTED